ncbi:class I SAM-dependent methyltransferase [Patescibacteria group bacterium]|nr:class I SAM-dependent methyltransferase [Patescibacteria group bacterium]
MKKTEKLLQKIKDDYNQIASHFSQTRVMPWTEFGLFKEYIKPGQKILDLGCGNGRWYKFLIDQHLPVEYYGLDNSEQLIKVAKETYSNEAARFILGELTKLNFPENSFEVVVCIATLHHLPSRQLRQQAIAEIYRVLKPGGYFLMTNWYLWNTVNFKNYFNCFWQKSSFKDFFIPWKDPQGNVLSQRYYYAFTKRKLAKLLQTANFKVERNFSQSRQKKSGKAKGVNLVSIARKE